MAVIKSSDLDFDAIKGNLKSYFENTSEFADYDFEGSGLSNILDVLAYNTHLNGLIANVGINESFLSSSQLRSSVIAHAQTLGYDVKSRTASMALINVSVVTSDTSTQTLTLPAGTEFTTDVDDVVYSFKTLENYTAINDGTGTFVFKTSSGSTSIPVYEGSSKTKTYLVGQVDDEQVYVIPDTTVDTTTLRVLVYDNPTASNYTTYSNINEVVRITSTSTVYIVSEVPNGYYELTFSQNNVLGKSPEANNKVVVTYLSPVGADANGGETFVTDFELLSTSLTVSTVSSSAGGSTKESIASIKQNAPRTYATQQRLVTAEDYVAIIANRYSSVLDDVVAWGGNDNVPPIYGRVYVALKFKDGIDADTKQTTKDAISGLLSPSLGIMSIDTYFTDPTNTYLELSTFFDFNPDQTGFTAQTTENLVSQTISNYFATNLNKFESVFRRSNLLAVIDDLSPAILNSRMDVKIQQRLVPDADDELGRVSNYKIYFPVVLANPDDVNYTITSSNFTYNGVSCQFRNKLNSTTLQITTPNGSLIVGNAGIYDTATGTVTITGVNITAYDGDYIRITATPANQSTIKPLRNYFLSYDTGRSVTSSTVDYETTAVTL
jgi:hypothetical protein